MSEASLLQSDPFPLTIDPSSYVPSPARERALAQLVSALEAGAVPCLEGPTGIGKTLLLRVFAERVSARYTPLYLPYPLLSAREHCAMVLGLLTRSSASDPETVLEAVAAELALNGRPLLLLLDDAASLPPESARGLAALVARSHRRLRIVLAGIGGEALLRAIEPFGDGLVRVTLEEGVPDTALAGYVAAQLERAHAPESMWRAFDDDTLAELGRQAAGNPRQLHIAAQTILRKVEEAASPFAHVAQRSTPSAAPREEIPLRVAPPPAARAAAETERTAPRAESFETPTASSAPVIPTLPERRDVSAVVSNVPAEPAAPVAPPVPIQVAAPVPREVARPATSELTRPVPVESWVSPPATAPVAEPEESAVESAPFETSDAPPEATSVEVLIAALASAPVEAAVEASIPVPVEPTIETPPAPTPARVSVPPREPAGEYRFVRGRATSADAAPSRAESKQGRTPELPPAQVDLTLAPLLEVQRAQAAAPARARTSAERAPRRALPIAGIALVAAISAVIGFALASQMDRGRDGLQTVLSWIAAARSQTPPPEPDRAAAPSAVPEAAAAVTPEAAPPPSPEAPQPEVEAVTPAAPEPGLAATLEELVVMNAPPAAEAPAAADEPAEPIAPSPPPPPPIEVSINATPWARIEIDGVPAGETPLGAVPLQPGTHRFRALFPDGRVRERNIQIDAEHRTVVFE